MRGWPGTHPPHPLNHQLQYFNANRCIIIFTSKWCILIINWFRNGHITVIFTIFSLLGYGYLKSRYGSIKQYKKSGYSTLKSGYGSLQLYPEIGVWVLCYQFVDVLVNLIWRGLLCPKKCPKDYVRFEQVSDSLHAVDQQNLWMIFYQLLWASGIMFQFLNGNTRSKMLFSVVLVCGLLYLW